jgi:GTPase SAR1 family protein
MTVQFVDGHFVDSYYPTIENTFSKMIRWKNQDYATEIIDTAGQVREVFMPLHKQAATPPQV